MICTPAVDDDVRLAEAHPAYVERLAAGVGQYLVNPFSFATSRDKLEALRPQCRSSDTVPATAGLAA